MDRLVATSVSSLDYDRRCGTQLVDSIMSHWGYNYVRYNDPLWFGWASKLEYMGRAVHDLPESEYILFIDCVDVVVLCSPDELIDRFEAFGHPWVFNAELNIWSPGSFAPEEYPTPDVPYRYLNSGVHIGRRDHMIEWYDNWLTEDVRALCRRGDQDFYAGKFIEHYPDAIALDTNCDLFQTGCGSLVKGNEMIELHPGRCVNLVTGTEPVVVHFNGGDDITADNRKVIWEGLV